MKRIFSTSVAIICGLGLAISCGKEDVQESVQEPVTQDTPATDNIIYLIAEGFGDDNTKVSVLDDTVIWETGDEIGYNYRGRSTVTVSDDIAYIPGGII